MYKYSVNEEKIAKLSIIRSKLFAIFSILTLNSRANDIDIFQFGPVQVAQAIAGHVTVFHVDIEEMVSHERALL